MAPKNEMMEEEIDLKLLLFRVLHAWRAVVLTTVILAVLLGGYKAVGICLNRKTEETVSDEWSAYELTQIQYENSVSDCEHKIEELEEEIRAQKEYLADSPLMNMDPFHVWVAQKRFFVKTDYQILPGNVYQSPNYTDTVLAMYQAALTDLAFMQNVADKAGMEERYLEELVSVSQGGYVLTVRVENSTEAGAAAIMDAMLEGMEPARKQILSAIGEHTVSELNSSISSHIDTGLQEAQKSQQDRLTTLTGSLLDTETELLELKKKAPQELLSETGVKAIVKWTLLGAALGVFLSVFCVCIAYLMGDKVFSPQEMRKRCGVTLLGVYPLPAKKRNAVDAWIRKLEKRTESSGAFQGYQMIAASAAMYGAGLGRILVAGTAGDRLLADIAGNLQKEIQEPEIISGGNILTDGRALKQLQECDGVVLVEQCGFTTYGDIADETGIIGNMGKKLVGCVLSD